MALLAIQYAGKMGFNRTHLSPCCKDLGLLSRVIRAKRVSFVKHCVIDHRYAELWYLRRQH